MLGKYLFYIGIGLTIVGALVSYFPRAFIWFGRLPGDFTYKNNGMSIYLPLASSIVVSLLVSLLIKLISR